MTRSRQSTEYCVLRLRTLRTGEFVIKQGERRDWRLTRVCAVMSLAAIVFAPSAHARCVGPQMTQLQGIKLGTDAKSSDIALEPGEVLDITGEWYANGCDDTSTTGLGCNAPERETPEPMTEVPITLSQGGDRTWDLGTVDASGDRFAVNWSGTVPEDVAQGPATLTVGPTSIAVEIADR